MRQQTADEITRELYGVRFDSLNHPEMPEVKTQRVYKARWVNGIGVEVEAVWHPDSKETDGEFFEINGVRVCQRVSEIMTNTGFRWMHSEEAK